MNETQNKNERNYFDTIIQMAFSQHVSAAYLNYDHRYS